MTDANKIFFFQKKRIKTEREREKILGTCVSQVSHTYSQKMFWPGIGLDYSYSMKSYICTFMPSNYALPYLLVYTVGFIPFCHLQ